MSWANPFWPTLYKSWNKRKQHTTVYFVVCFMVMFIALSFHCNFFCLASFPQITSCCDYRLGTFITDHPDDELHIHHPAKIMAKPEAFQSQSDFSTVTKNAQREKERTRTSACSQPCGSKPNFLLNAGAKSQAGSPCLKWLLEDLSYWWQYNGSRNHNWAEFPA